MLAGLLRRRPDPQRGLRFRRRPTRPALRDGGAGRPADRRRTHGRSRHRPQRAARGLALPRGRRPGRRRAALRPRPRLVPGHRHARGHRDAHLPLDRDRRRRSSSTSARSSRSSAAHRRRDRRGVRAARQGPGDPGAGARGRALRGGDRLLRHARAGRRTHAAVGLRRDRLHDHRRPRGVDDAGAVGRLLVVRRQRPPLRQGALRLHAVRALARGWASPNGDLLSTEDVDGLTVTRWHLAEPAASYLATLAFGDYEQTELTGPRDIPIRIFTPRDEPDAVRGPVDRAGGDGVARAVRRPLPVRHVRHPRRRLVRAAWRPRPW